MCVFMCFPNVIPRWTFGEHRSRPTKVVAKGLAGCTSVVASSVLGQILGDLGHFGTVFADLAWFQPPKKTRRSAFWVCVMECTDLKKNKTIVQQFNFLQLRHTRKRCKQPAFSLQILGMPVLRHQRLQKSLESLLTLYWWMRPIFCCPPRKRTFA